MPRDPKSRDITLNSLALITGGLTAAAFVGTGWVTGLAADYTAQKAETKALATAAAAAAVTAAPAPQPAPTPRPTRTVITTRVVQAASGVGRAGTFRGTSFGTTSRAAAPAAAAPARAAAPAPVRVKAVAVAPAPSAAS
jgi:translation initiation factor IF-3